DRGRQDRVQRGGARGGARPNDVSECEGRGACRGRPKGWSEHDGTYGRDRNDHPIPGSSNRGNGREGSQGRRLSSGLSRLHAKEGFLDILYKNNKRYF